jgi:hypothetical protein
MKGRTTMATESVTLELDEAAARIFKEATPEQRRSLEALVSLHLLEASASRQSLRELMDTVGQQAEARGLTEERLQELLREARKHASRTSGRDAQV